MRNYGLDIDRERSEQSPEDWLFGALSQPGLANIPLPHRLTYLPKGEVQRGAEDFSDCVTRAYHNVLEAQFTWLLKNEKLTLENEQWLIAKGYVNAGRVEFSDRFTAILSGTTRQGNSMKAPADSIRKNGLIPKSMLPKKEGMTFDEYHDRSKITDEMVSIGKEFTHRFSINYEQVHRTHIKDANKDDLLAVAVHAWPFPVKGIYPQTSNPLNHCVMLIQPEYEAFDNYTEAANDFTKTLAPDFTFYEYAYRIFISAENSYTAQVSLWKKLVEALTKMVGLLSTPKPAPKPEPKPAPANNLLNTLILIMRKHEGWILNPPSRSVRNNNPLNCRFSPVGYLPIYGTVRRDPDNFAIFQTYEIGHLYAKNLILQKAKKHPDWNLVQFIGDEYEGWAPASDNNDVDRYATVLAQGLGVSKTAWKLGNLLS